LRKAGLGAITSGIGIREAFSRLQIGGGRPPPAELRPLIGKVFGDILPRQVVAELGPILDANRPDVMIYGAGTSEPAWRRGSPEFLLSAAVSDASGVDLPAEY
jgi:hypothetical protein